MGGCSSGLVGLERFEGVYFVCGMVDGYGVSGYGVTCRGRGDGCFGFVGFTEFGF